MNNTLKIFCRDAEQDKLAEQYPAIARYQGFLVTDVAPDNIDALARHYPVENITAHYTLRLGDQEIDTSRPRLDIKGKLHSHPHYKNEKKLSAGYHHHLVQFIGPIKQQWLKNIKKVGAELRDPLNAFTYVVRSNDKTLTKLIALPYVRWVGHLPTSNRIETTLLNRAGRKSDDFFSVLPRTRILPGAYVIEFFATKELTSSLAAIKKLGFVILSKDPKSKVLVISDPKSGAATAKRIKALSVIHGVRYIRERVIKRTCNDVAALIMGTEQSMAIANHGLSGLGETIGICDTGIDNADPQSIHPDFAGRIAGIKSFPISPDLSPYVSNPKGDDGAADLDSGHGTHVAGSVLGNGSASDDLPDFNSTIRGLSHKAKLYFQAIEQEMKWQNPEHLKTYGRYMLAGLPNDLTDLFADAYKNKVRIHSNSWGGGDPGVYDAQSEQLDRFIWNKKDFCVLFANGNDGTDADGDGKINAMSVTSPATAKNCISVGASENERPNFNDATYGGWWSNDYPVTPFSTDPMADNAENVAAFSSRGPTSDGRFKPDVVAPGTFILSTRSTMLAANNKAWAAFPPSKKYFHMGGTSMATPLTSGAVGLIREYLRKVKNFKSPSAALLKASLIHGAVRLPSTNASDIVDNDQGYGRVNLDAVLASPGSRTIEFNDITPGLNTGELHSIELQIISADQPLHITLVYSDYPGVTLINNLNLILTAPDGRRHVGNPKQGNLLTLDTTNNVEVINIKKPLAGKWLIEIVASNVSQGPQDFALVYSANTGTTANSVSSIHVSEEPMLTIPDRDPVGVSSSISITDNGIISSLQIGVDIQHSYIGDLKVSLTGPEQQEVILHERTGASNNDLIKTYDAQNTAALTVFNNTPANGEWKLTVADHAQLDEGRLRQWSLDLTLLASNKTEETSMPFIAIPDNNTQGISDTLSLSETGIVKSILVSVDITHTWIADLTVSLTAPDGSSIKLHNKTGGSLDNIIKTYNLDNLPELNNFNDLNMNGDWVIKVVDSAGRDVGKLNQWGLVISWE